MLVNRNNFLRWDDGSSPSTVEADLPTGYILDPNRCDYLPLFAASEAMIFHINAPAGLSWADDPNTHKLALISEAGTVINANVATLQVHNFTATAGAAKTYYASVTIDGTVTAGIYYYQIKTAGGTVKLTSNKFRVVAAGTAHREYSSLCKFRHDRYFYGTNYQDLATFYQQFRIHLNQIDTQFDNDREVYNEVTTGKQRQYNNFMKEVKKVETYYFDKYAHEAATVMFDHDELYINLKRYTKKSEYKINTNQRSKISKGECELYYEEFASANRCTD